MSATIKTADEREAYTDPLSDFQEGQWWVAELDAWATSGTDQQKRAVAVVHHMLRSASLAAERVPEPAALPTDPYETYGKRGECDAPSLKGRAAIVEAWNDLAIEVRKHPGLAKLWYAVGQCEDAEPAASAQAAAVPEQTVGSALTAEQLGAIAYQGFNSYWTEDCAGSDSEAWAESAKAVVKATLSRPTAAGEAEPVRKAFEDWFRSTGRPGEQMPEGYLKRSAPDSSGSWANRIAEESGESEVYGQGWVQLAWTGWKHRPASPEDAQEVGKDAARYRHLRARHEIDDEQASNTNYGKNYPQRTLTVFQDDGEDGLEPVPCDPGALDAAIDIAIESIDRRAG